MNINHLRYFVDAVELQSCSAAARKNSISQPALSQSIRNLETEFGCEILSHKPKTFKLTEKGHSLLDYAYKILSLIEEAKLNFSTVETIKKPVRIACTHSFFKYYLKYSLLELSTAYPNWKPVIAFGNRSTIKNGLLDNKYDIGFIVSSENLNRFNTQEIKSGFFYKISQSQIEEKNKKPLYVTSLKDKEIKKAKANIKDYELTEVGSWESIYELVTSNLGSGIVPDYIINKPELKQDRLTPYSMLMIQKKLKNLPCSDYASLLYKNVKKCLS